MRVWHVCLLAMLLTLMAATGQAQSFHAGLTRGPVPADPSFDALVWYPTQTDEVPWQIGPFPIPATRDAPIAPGRFPVILLSHGGGSGGSPLILREPAAFLARRGFVVIAPFHGPIEHSLVVRPRQIGAALQAVLAGPHFAGHVDPDRIGMLGFSLGGAITLLAAGADPDMATLEAYCRTHADDAKACTGTSSDGQPLHRRLPAIPKLPLKAIALLDPLGALFSQDDLAIVTMPVLIVRPQDSDLQEAGNAGMLARALPNPPQLLRVPGGHFVLADRCPDALRTESPELCEDAPGIDRATIHAQILDTLAAFFEGHL